MTVRDMVKKLVSEDIVVEKEHIHMDIQPSSHSAKNIGMCRKQYGMMKGEHNEKGND